MLTILNTAQNPQMLASFYGMKIQRTKVSQSIPKVAGMEMIEIVSRMTALLSRDLLKIEMHPSAVVLAIFVTVISLMVT